MRKADGQIQWDSESSFTELSRRLPQASSAWWRTIWKARADLWRERLGDTLRVETCLPQATGETLRELLSQEFPAALPDELTADMVDANKGPLTNGRKGTQKLTRYLAQILRAAWTADDYYCPRVYDRHGYGYDSYGEDQLSYGNDPASYAPHPEYLAELDTRVPLEVGKVFERVQKHNGLRLVLSANPLDVLDSGNYCDYDSCHGWYDDYAGSYCAGNFALSNTPRCLIAYLYRDCGDNGRVPHKIWRQLIYTGDGFAVMARQYGSELIEFRHAIIRKLVAETLLGPPGCDWRWDRASSRRISYADDGPYQGDSLQGTVVLSSSPEKSYGYSVAVKGTRCPSCNAVRCLPKSDELLCGSCGGGDDEEKSHCPDCDEYVEDSNDWLTLAGGRTVCPSCAQSYSLCEHCESHTSDDLTSVHRRGVDTRCIDVCDSCLDDDYTRCVECHEWVHNDYSDESDRCDSCHIEEEEEPAHLVDNGLSVTTLCDGSDHNCRTCHPQTRN